VKINDDHTEKKDEKNGVAIVGGLLKAGASLAGSIPIVGSILELLNSGMDAIYAHVKAKHFEDRVKSICMIVEQNKDPKA
jgi:hypothetical protein